MTNFTFLNNFEIVKSIFNSYEGIAYTWDTVTVSELVLCSRQTRKSLYMNKGITFTHVSVILFSFNRLKSGKVGKIIFGL